MLFLLKCDFFSKSRPLLPCFYISISLFSFQGAAEVTKCTLKIEQCKNLILKSRVTTFG